MLEELSAALGNVYRPKACCGLLILKLYSWSFIRLWKTTKPQVGISSVALGKVKGKKVPVQTMNAY
jgi:hypothetical protein